MIADIVIKNGKCMTMVDKTIHTWLAVKGDRILALGDGQGYETYLGDKTICLDAEGHTVMPGFIDSHFHVVQTALNAISLDLSAVKSHEELGERIRKAHAESNGAFVRGIGVSAEQFEEGCFPTRTLLDKYCDNVPVWLNSLEYQVSVLNTYAMLYFKIPFTADGVEVDEKQMPTGVFYRNANAILRANILKNISNQDRREAISNIMERLLSNGITTVNAMEGGYMYSDKDADFIYENKSVFPIDIELFYQSMDIKMIQEMGLTRLGGSLYIDGTMGSRTAALSFEYADAPGKMGRLFLSQQEINEFVLACYQNNLQLALYTIGDRAIQSALEAHENALYQTGIKGLRHRLEHVELPTEAQIEKAKELNIIFSMQPTYELYWGGPGKMYESRLGDYYVNTNPFRAILDHGVLICGGSDCDITEPRPFLGIHGAVNHPVEKHRVSLYEALKMFTYNGAYAIFKEDEKGSLVAGKLADILILDCDIHAVPKNEIEQVKIMTTIKSGEVLFNRQV
ncbi:MAG: amidohydrolase [Clostridia bacterium]|nr:amidohydrolase [Clostridia bacterium]